MNNLPPGQSIPTAPKTSGMATTSLVLGIMSFVCLLGPILGIPAIITGHLSRNKIRHSQGTLSGEGLGLAGLIMGYVNLGLSIIMIPLLAAIAIPNFVKARTMAQQNACIHNLRMIESAKQQWALEFKKEPTDVPTQADISGYLKAWPTCPAKGTYTLGTAEEEATCSVSGHELPSESAE